MPSSSLVEIEVEFEVGVEVGVEVRVGIGGAGVGVGSLRWGVEDEDKTLPEECPLVHIITGKKIAVINKFDYVHGNTLHRVKC